MVFDQMRPDYIDRFDLGNFKRLRDSSRNYPEAYVGHLASQTIVSHLVIPTGLAPKDLPWQDDAIVDVEGVMGKPGAAYDADAFTREECGVSLNGCRESVFFQRGSGRAGAGLLDRSKGYAAQCIRRAARVDDRHAGTSGGTLRTGRRQRSCVHLRERALLARMRRDLRHRPLDGLHARWQPVTSPATIPRAPAVTSGR